MFGGNNAVLSDFRASFQVLELLRVFFCNNIFLDDLALRMALETQLDQGHQRAEQTVELMASTLYKGAGSVISRKVERETKR